MLCILLLLPSWTPSMSAATASSRALYMSANQDLHHGLSLREAAALKSAAVRIDAETIEAVKAAASAEVVPVDDLAPRVPGADTAIVQYGEAASFFGRLLEEREASRAGAQSTPIETILKQKVLRMSFLQSKLEHVTSAGLASEARRRWLVDKAALEREKRECKQEWAELRARHEHSAAAWDQLASTATGQHTEGQAADAAVARSTALTVASQWTAGTILSRTSLKEQVALIEEQKSLSERQMAIDHEDAQLMKTALRLYQEERPSREARAELLRGLHTLLAEIRHLVEETSAFNGHAAFVEEGFVEGLSY